MTEVHHGLEGVVAFETQIAEPDKEGSALRYRGVDIEDIVGRVPFENVWGLLVDGSYTPGLPPAEPYNIAIHTGDVRADVQASVAMLAPMLGMGQTYDISDEQARLDLSRVAVMVQDRAGDDQTLARFVVELDGAPIYRSDGEIAGGGEGTRIHEGALAPGPHVLTLEVEQRAREDAEYRYVMRDTFRFIVVRERLTEITIVLEDDSDVATSFRSGGEGRYDVRTRVRIATRELPRS